MRYDNMLSAVCARRLPTNDFDVVVAKHVAQELRRSVSEDEPDIWITDIWITDTVRTQNNRSGMRAAFLQRRQVKSPGCYSFLVFEETCLMCQAVI